MDHQQAIFCPDNFVKNGLISKEKCLTGERRYKRFTDETVVSIISAMKKLKAEEIKAIMIPRTFLTNVGIDALCQVIQLEELDLSFCRLNNEHVVKLSESLSKLKRLNIGSNKVIDDISSLKKLKDLEYLNISDTNVEQCDLDWLRNSKLIWINLGYTRITEKDKKAIEYTLTDKNSQNIELRKEEAIESNLKSTAADPVNVYESI